MQGANSINVLLESSIRAASHRDKDLHILSTAPFAEEKSWGHTINSAALKDQCLLFDFLPSFLSDSVSIMAQPMRKDVSFRDLSMIGTGFTRLRERETGVHMSMSNIKFDRVTLDRETQVLEDPFEPTPFHLCMDKFQAVDATSTTAGYKGNSEGPGGALGEWLDSLLRKNGGGYPQQDSLFALLLEDAQHSDPNHSEPRHLQVKTECKHTTSEISASVPASDSTRATPTNLADPRQMPLLRECMTQSDKTQQALQDWDKQNGLPQTHSRTMLSTSRSRCQLEKGRILRKWDGAPLIDGKPACATKVKGKKKRVTRKYTKKCSQVK